MISEECTYFCKIWLGDYQVEKTKAHSLPLKKGCYFVKSFKCKNCLVLMSDICCALLASFFRLKSL